MANNTHKNRKKPLLITGAVLLTVILAAFILLRIPHNPGDLYRGKSATETSVLHSNDGKIVRCDYENWGRTEAFPDGCTVYQARGTGMKHIIWSFPGTSCDIHYFEDGWMQHVSRTIVNHKMVHIDIENSSDDPDAIRSLIICPPKSYRMLERESIEEDPAYKGSVSAIAFLGRVYVILRVPQPRDGYFWDWTCFASSEPLTDWNDTKGDPLQWTVWHYDGDNRMTMDGYYCSAPSTYEPGGDNVFEHAPKLYIAIKQAMYGRNPGTCNMGIFMLDLARSTLTDDGYLPTLSKSQWLWEDYGIDAGFYDTRFNNDAMRAYLKLSKDRGIVEFREVADRFYTFYTRHIEERGYVFENGGILVPDYGQDGVNVPIHTALNHQLAELEFLYDYGTPESIDLMYRLLDGIKALGTDWIMDDGSLEYAWHPENGFCFTDYPYLTYNDLWDVQRILEKHQGFRDPLLDTLMESKLASMKEKGIHGYAGEGK